MGERLNLTPEQQRKVERAQALLQEVWNAMTQEARAGSHHRTAGAVATITAPKDNPMPNEPTPAWRARLEHGVLPEEPGRRVLVSADDRDAALSALDAATARAAKAEEENKILIQMHQHMCDLVGHDQAEAYHTGRHANLEAQTALIAALEAQAQARGGETAGADELAWRVCRVIKIQCQRCPAEEMMGGEMCGIMAQTPQTGWAGERR